MVSVALAIRPYRGSVTRPRFLGKLRATYIFSRHVRTDGVFGRQPLALHAVSFGPDSRSSTLRRMVDISREVYRSAPQNSLGPSAPSEACTFSRALNTVRFDRWLCTRKATDNELGVDTIG